MLRDFPINSVWKWAFKTVTAAVNWKANKKTSDCSAINGENDRRQNVQNFAVKPLNSAPSSTWDVVAIRSITA